MSNIIRGAQAKHLIATSAAQLLDVRTPQEVQENPVSEAQVIPLDNLLGQITDLDPERPVIVFCRSGKRSKIAIELLKGFGFEELWDLESYAYWDTSE